MVDTLAPNDVRSIYGNKGKLVLDYLVRNGFCVKEYYVDGEWIERPVGSVRGIRYAIENLKILDDICGIINYIDSESIQDPVKYDDIFDQFLSGRTNGCNITFYSPWGPRYKSKRATIENGDPEITTLYQIQQTLEEFRIRGYKTSLLLMVADTYGTEINGFSEDFVLEYFRWLEDRSFQIIGRESNLSVFKWSDIRSNNSGLYTETRELANNNFRNLVTENEYRKAADVARKFNPDNSEKSARNYCIERVTEGILIDLLFNPIKLSLVRKEKDALDGPLKRIYVVKNRAPWLRVIR